MSAVAIVELMIELVPDGGKALEQRDGPQALEIVQEIEGALMSAMEGTLANVLLWEQFLLTPGEVASALTGVVQALMEADPVLAEWLEAALVRYRRVSVPSNEALSNEGRRPL
jgi:hypothetical protein